MSLLNEKSFNSLSLLFSIQTDALPYNYYTIK